MKVATWVAGPGAHPYKAARAHIHEMLARLEDAALLGDWDDHESLLRDDTCSKADIIISYTQKGHLDPEHVTALSKFIEDGGGFVGIHGATASFKQSPGYHDLLGGRFTGHGHARKFPVEIVRAHPVTDGVSAFSIKDEPYENEIYEGTTVLAERVNKDGARHAMVFVKEHGKGRIAYIAFGHFGKCFKHPGVQRLITNAIKWCAHQA